MKIEVVAVMFAACSWLAAGCAAVDEETAESASLVDSPYAVGVSVESVELGQEVLVTWHAPADHNPSDVIHLCKVGAPNGVYIAWDRAGGAGLTTGTLRFQLPLTPALDKGPFEVRYFAAGSWTHVATSNPFRGTGDYSIGQSPGTVEMGQPFTVSWRAPLAHSHGDRIVVYKVGSNSIWQESLPVEHPGEPTGTVTFHGFPMSPYVDPGPWEARYFFAGTSTRMAVSEPFTVHATYGVTSASSCVFGQPFAASWAAPRAHSPGDVLHVGRAGMPSAYPITWGPVGGAGDGSGTVILPPPHGDVDGLYELRYYFAGSGVVKATSEPFICRH